MRVTNLSESLPDGKQDEDGAVPEASGGQQFWVRYRGTDEKNLSVLDYEFV